ncbi:MAG: UDP-N-acetylmuramoyl-tripeptide--D-alanyl-D-alanine ligase [bacterium]
MFKRILQLKLRIFAKLILARYKPDVVGITGSVGKTGTKEAIYLVLSKKFQARRSEKNYNNEIGLPLTIIGSNSPGKNFFGWVWIFFKATKIILFKDKNYPKVLILEMGVDRIGDMKYLNSIVKCKIGVVTFVGATHLEYFGTIEKTQKEKGELIRDLKKNGWAILNYDNLQAREIAKMSKSRVLTYGLEEGSDVWAQQVVFSFDGEKKRENLKGISFKLSHNGSFAPVLLPNVIGYNSVYAALAGASCGIAMGMNLIEISEALREFNLPKGRMNLIPGIKYTMIIDDSYNSAPDSAISALEIVKRIPIEYGAQKFAALGDMLELGRESERGHREVGRYLVECGIDKLIAVGEYAIDIGVGAKEAGMKDDNIFYFSNSEEAGLFIQNRIKKGDLILVKGSQGARMEKIVKELMAEPLRAEELLVRQEPTWSRK